MLQIYFKIAWRNLQRNKIYSFINIIGLATGLCCFLLIALYVIDELSYDKYNDKADRIYRINADILFGGNNMHFTQTSDMMGEVLKKDYPQVEEYTRIYNNNGNKLVKKGTEFIYQDETAYVDSTFFRVFTLPAISGNTQTALNEPNTVVISRSAALKYFGTTDAVGKLLETKDDGGRAYKVTAVIEDVPENSHFHFDFFFSMKNVDYQWGQFVSHNFHTYLLLKSGTDAKAFEKNFDQYIEKYVLPQARQFMQINSMDEFKKAGNSLEYSLMPITKIHLYSDRNLEITPSGNIQYIYIFSAVALFILLIACVNFMNLTTARSANRAKEVGIRKVLGTERKSLIIQFLSESMLMVILSLLIALALTYLILPLFNGLANKTIIFSNLASPVILPLLFVLPLIVGLIAGSYPAFYLSSFKPIFVLKGRLANKRGRLRGALVIFQFAASIVLIIGTIVIFRQLNYIQTKDLGYKKDQVLIVNGAFALQKNAGAFKNEVLQMPGVVSGTLSSFLPVSNSSRSDNTFSKEAVMDSKTGFNMQCWNIDYDYLKTMGMALTKGRNFSKDFGGDSSGVIINETTAKFLGYADPVGRDLYRNDNDGRQTKYTIIGVVKNFNYESIKQTIAPLSLFLTKNDFGLAIFKISPVNLPNLLASIQAKWKTMAAGFPYSYRFLDESFNEMYQSEQRIGKIALIFSVVAILIACLGLFGLAAFVAEQRTKEIGIRKVLGASVVHIVNMLSKDFLKLVIIAALIAIPVSWWFMHHWLMDFAYRISIGWWVFVMAAVIAVIIALATICSQAIKAAIANPVKSLRTD